MKLGVRYLILTAVPGVVALWLLAACATSPATSPPGAASPPGVPGPAPTSLPVASPTLATVLPPLPTLPPFPTPEAPALLPTASPTNTPGPLIIGLGNDGSTVVAPTGQTILLELGSDYDWTVTVEDSSIISRIPDHPMASGSQGVYVAKRPGRTAITAVGELPCRKEQPPCEAPSRLFRVEIVVE